ncbi:class I SAM-dependent methyltransferase [Riemerella columbina]|uniref:class I SAM-dependent methyltransferase n=1 Tax=Riemerella columbina TaxID=103810 RepID=UPI00038288D0|nr:class I SAM-dependent methyltransferase [Riemerella columbina]
MTTHPLLSKEISEFVATFNPREALSVLLKKPLFPEVTNQQLVQQIEGRAIAAKKLPFLDRTDILFPPKLNLEQTSSQTTAAYKAQQVSGTRFLDLTCGFGIDAYFLSAHFEETTLVERNTALMEMVMHNWDALSKKATFINEDLEAFLAQDNQTYDLIYLDPARRNQQQKKVFLLEDLSPNLLDIQNQLLEKSTKILIKLSPLIDLKYLTTVLKSIEWIHIVAVKNEVKEVLVLQNICYTQDKISCKAVNLESHEPDFDFSIDDIHTQSIAYAAPLRYLYIPNHAVLKSGAFGVLASRFGLKKLHPNTHFFTSDDIVEGFPGRILEVEPIESKRLKKNDIYNIISKNHPLSPQQIKKKYKLKDGGTDYLIFTQSIDGKIILKSI